MNKPTHGLRVVLAVDDFTTKAGMIAGPHLKNYPLTVSDA